jgi:hypothetical protein
VLENSLQTIDLVIVLSLGAVILGIIGGFLQRKGIFLQVKGATKKRMARNIYGALLHLPAAVIMTYVIWPGNTLNFVFRILIGIGFVILVFGYISFIFEPLLARTSQNYQKYMQED